MSWKQVAKSNDLIIFEKNLKKYKIKIEARRENDFWNIFKTKIVGEKSTLLSQIKVHNNELKDILKKLKMNKQDIDINTLQETKNRPIFISMKRLFKDEYTEKWEFKLEKEDKNFILLNFEAALEVDIIIHKKYKPYEKQILEQLKTNLGFNELADEIYTKIYYFDDTSYYSEQFQPFFEVEDEFDF